MLNTSQVLLASTGRAASVRLLETITVWVGPRSAAEYAADSCTEMEGAGPISQYFRSNMIRYLPRNRANDDPLSRATLPGTAPKAARALGVHVVLRRGACCIQDWNDLHVAENEIRAESICTSFPIWPHAVSTVEEGFSSVCVEMPRNA
jgi:hypothetical protein